METSLIRVLVVEDSERFRNFVCSTLGERPELQIVGVVADGLQAVQRADELQPDLILLDIGLPLLNGIEVARQIRRLSPKSKILFVSQEFSGDVVREALGTGAHGFVVKIDAGSELLKGVSAVLRGDQFVSRSFAGHDFGAASDAVASIEVRTQSAVEPLQLNMQRARRHDVGFYPDDESLLVNLTLFIGTALNAGHGAIVVATESHRNSLLPRLKRHGVDIAAAIKQGKYISLDASDALSTFMIGGMVDRARFMETFGTLIVTATKAASGKHPRVAVFGEGAHLLWSQGNVPAAIQDERLCNELTKIYDVDILCGYSVENVQGGMDTHVFRQICAQHGSTFYQRR